jgi:ankyrin repeat protein
LTLLHLPVESEGGHLDVAQFFIEHGADTAAQGEEGSTLLRGDPARFLVEHGANLNAAAQGEGGSTPLHRASSSWSSRPGTIPC